MKNFALCFWAVLLSLLVSCGNEMSIDNSDAQDKQAGTGTYITINSSSLARTIRPSSEEVKALEASLTDFTFTGTDSYSNEITFTQTPISSIEQLKSQRFAIAPGTWSFTLSAKLGASSTSFTSTLENNQNRSEQNHSALIRACIGKRRRHEHHSHVHGQEHHESPNEPHQA